MDYCGADSRTALIADLKLLFSLCRPLLIFTTAFLFKASTKHQRNELLKQTEFAQPKRKSRTVLAKEIVFVTAGQLSRGKEISEQEYYYETIAVLILIGKRLGQSPSRRY